MKEDPCAAWCQVRFAASDGRSEVLWAEPLADGGLFVLNVPVWLYGVSAGTVVEARDAGERFLRFSRALRPSRGGTVRYVVPQGGSASRLYMERIGPESAAARLGIGPATFFDPLLAAVHVRDRHDLWEGVADYLDRLYEAGLIRQWEVGDPDEEPALEVDPGQNVDPDRELVHPRPPPDRASLLVREQHLRGREQP